MSAKFDELEQQARTLGARDKARLARALIDDLDPATDAGAEEMWIEEAKRRYDAYRAGSLETASGEEAMQRARRHLK